jgi:hypothetical protein
MEGPCPSSGALNRLMMIVIPEEGLYVYNMLNIVEKHFVPLRHFCKAGRYRLVSSVNTVLNISKNYRRCPRNVSASQKSSLYIEIHTEDQIEFVVPNNLIHTYLSRFIPESVADTSQISSATPSFYQNDLAMRNTADVSGGKLIGV